MTSTRLTIADVERMFPMDDGNRYELIVDWVRRRIDVHRREKDALQLCVTLEEGDTLESPRLPGFSLPVASVFGQLPAENSAG